MSIDIAAEIKFSHVAGTEYLVKLRDAEQTTIGYVRKLSGGWSAFDLDRAPHGSNSSVRLTAAAHLLATYELANGLRDSEGRRVAKDVETRLWCVVDFRGVRDGSSRWTDKADAIAHLKSLQTPAVEPKTPAASKTAVDFDRIVQIAVEDADAIALTGNGETRTSLRRYRLVRLFGGHTLRELKDALTLPEMVAERGSLGRPLVKDDYVNLLVSKALHSLTEDAEPTDEQLDHFEEVGRHAALADEQAAPALNGTIQAAFRGRAVGDPFNTAIMKAFTRGYDAVREEQAAEVLTGDAAVDASRADQDRAINEMLAGHGLKAEGFDLVPLHTITDQDIRERVVEPLLGRFAADYDIDAIMTDLFARWPLSEWTYADLKYDHVDFNGDSFAEIIQRHDQTAEEPVEVTPVMVWSDGTVSTGVEELRNHLQRAAYGHDDGEVPALYVTQGGGLEKATTRRLSRHTDENDWIDEQIGVFAGDADAPVITIGLRIDGRA